MVLPLALRGNPFLHEASRRGLGARERPRLRLRHPELAGNHELCTSGDTLQAQEALNAVEMHAPNRAGLAVWAACRAAVDQCLSHKPRWPLVPSASCGSHVK